MKNHSHRFNETKDFLGLSHRITLPSAVKLNTKTALLRLKTKAYQSSLETN